MSVSGYLREAEEFGDFRGVYERASRNGLSARELGYLAGELRRLKPQLDSKGREVEPPFKLTIRERHEVIATLLVVGVEDKTIRDWCGCSKQTIWRVRASESTALESQQSWPFGSKRGEQTQRPVLHFDASSGAQDDGALRRLLGAST